MIIDQLIIGQAHHFLRMIKYLRQIVLRFLLNYYLPSSQLFSTQVVFKQTKYLTISIFVSPLLHVPYFESVVPLDYFLT